MSCLLGRLKTNQVAEAAHTLWCGLTLISRLFEFWGKRDEEVKGKVGVVGAGIDDDNDEVFWSPTTTKAL